MSFRRRASVVASVAVALLFVAAPAWAHVGIEIDDARPGATATYTVSVPNESDAATTDRIEIEIPAGVEVHDFRPGPGWTMEVDDGVLVIQGGSIDPGEEREFRFTATNPMEQGEVAFPAIQTYSDGEEVRWVGEEGSDNPAPTVVYEGRPVATQAPETAPAPAPPTQAATQAASPAPTTPAATVAPASEAPTPTERATEEPAGDSGLPTVALALIFLALIGGGLVLVARRGPRD